MSGEPGEIVRWLEERGFQPAFIESGLTIQRFLAASLFITLQRAATVAASYRVNMRLLLRPLYSSLHRH